MAENLWLLADYLPAARQADAELAVPMDRLLARLADDLDSGRWELEHANLLDADELDLGYRLVTAAA